MILLSTVSPLYLNFALMLSTNRTDMSHEDINKLLGSHLDTRDDYYAGRMTEPFKETVRYKDRNKAIDDANNNG